MPWGHNYVCYMSNCQYIGLHVGPTSICYVPTCRLRQYCGFIQHSDDGSNQISVGPIQTRIPRTPLMTNIYIRPTIVWHCSDCTGLPFIYRCPLLIHIRNIMLIQIRQICRITVACVTSVCYKGRGESSRRTIRPSIPHGNIHEIDAWKCPTQTQCG